MNYIFLRPEFLLKERESKRMKVCRESETKRENVLVCAAPTPVLMLTLTLI